MADKGLDTIVWAKEKVKKLQDVVHKVAEKERRAEDEERAAQEEVKEARKALERAREKEREARNRKTDAAATRQIVQQELEAVQTHLREYDSEEACFSDMEVLEIPESGARNVPSDSSALGTAVIMLIAALCKKYLL